MGNNFWLQRFLIKKTQKKSPIQEPYHIKVSLQEYYEKFEEWTIPDFSDKCLICGAADCAGYHGHYTRTVTCPLTGFSVPDFPVLRFLCQGKGDKKKCDHVTFSLLPIELVPFRQLTLKFMILAVWLRLGRQLSFTRALDDIEEELNHLGDIADFINISAVMSWERLIRAAFELFLLTDINLLCPIQYEKIIANKTSLLPFLELLKKYKSRNMNNPIRGPDAFAWDFYQQSGGTNKLVPFLFGKASQHRN